MKKAGDILSSIFSSASFDDAKMFFSFFSSWSEIAGQDLAAHSTLADVRNGAVLIEVDHPAWLQILQLKEKVVLYKLKKRFPELGIKSLQMKISSGAGMRPQKLAELKKRAEKNEEIRKEEEIKDQTDFEKGPSIKKSKKRYKLFREDEHLQQTFEKLKGHLKDK